MDFVALRKFIDEASKEVEAWPAWKRGVLEASMKPMNNDEPRKAVNQIERVEAMKVDGIPEGYELVRVGIPKDGELFIHGRVGHIDKYDEGVFYNTVYPIVRKVERPKEPTGRLLMPMSSSRIGIGGARLLIANHGCQNVTRTAFTSEDIKFTWEQAYIEITFDDGTPFGVEVVE
jgi:hypothetical protein